MTYNVYYTICKVIQNINLVKFQVKYDKCMNVGMYNISLET